MEVHYRQKGIGKTKIFTTLGLFSVTLFAFFILLQKPEDVATMESGEEETETAPEVIFVSKQEAFKDEEPFFATTGPVLADILPAYAGERLGGGEFTPVLTFTEEDYEQALSANALILLVFSGNWCTMCTEEHAHALLPAFASLTEKNIVAFRVHLNDNQTSAKEHALAREFEVSEQNTKVFLQYGRPVLRTSEPWLQATYLSTLQTLLTE